MSSVLLRDLKRLEWALVAHEKDVRAAIEAGMVTAARRGIAVARRNMSKSKVGRKPFASGTYANSWLSVPVRGGAAVTNSARHAVFVERGRLPGKAPPLAPILEWVYQKRIARRGKKLRTMRAKLIAIKIVKKIKKKGIKARPVLGISMPSITKFTIRESKRAVARVSRNPPK